MITVTVAIVPEPWGTADRRDLLEVATVTSEPLPGLILATSGHRLGRHHFVLVRRLLLHRS